MRSKVNGVTEEKSDCRIADTTTVQEILEKQPGKLSEGKLMGIMEENDCDKRKGFWEEVRSKNLEWSMTILQGKEKIFYHVIPGEEANTVQSTLDNFL